ncbi:MAG: alpha/beta hydrolase family protein, partial [Halobacteriales archaeon]
FGDQNLSTRLADLASVVDYFDPGRCVLFGSSFGGKVVFHAAVDDLPGSVDVSVAGRVEAVAARAPVTYSGVFDGVTSGTGGGSGAVNEGFLDDVQGYGFEAVEERLEVPAAVFHGREDATVPVAGSFRAAEAVEPDVALHVYADEGHLFSRQAESRMRDAFFHWLEYAVE